MTQIRPRIEPDLAPLIQEWADHYHLSFNAAVNALCSLGLYGPHGWTPPSTSQSEEIQR